ncbi:uncharacterized protein LOC122247827 [Penaeus japonicus]|uniref:uncharacterized protein LOC122247827 n=1 Tax=Penaeus japonicus TaxID=27405 RepID=UPI001C715953|nr:uncharacterized protein LOC122247827 [Penaeus japonicus]
MEQLALLTTCATWLLLSTTLVSLQLRLGSADENPAESREFRDPARIVGITGCFSTEEGERVLDCSSATDVIQIRNSVDKLTSENDLIFNRFKIVENTHIDRLPADLLGGLRVNVIEVVSCPSLTEVNGDFLGASKDTVLVIFLGYNALTRVPVLEAEGLLALDLFGNPIERVSPADFEGVGNLQSLILPPVTIDRLAFHSLKSLRTLAVPFLSVSLVTASPGIFYFDSLYLQEVFLPKSNFHYLPPGVFEGFPRGSKLVMESYNLTSPAVLFNLFSHGAALEFTGSITCGCQQAWIRMTPFLSLSTISCITEEGQTLLQDIEENEFVSCCQKSF